MHTAPTLSAPHQMDSMLSLADARSRAFAAAKLALRGESWGYVMQADCAADILSTILAELAAEQRQNARRADRCRRGVCGARPAYAVTLDDGSNGSATVPLCMLHSRGHADRRALIAYGDTDAVPAAVLSFSRLYGMANNWRRGEERARKRAAEGAKISGQQDGSGEDQTRAAATPDAARQTAVDTLDGLGLARLGKLYPVAYAAAREQYGLTGDEIAAELGVKPATLRKQISRAADRVPSAATYTAADHADALRVDEYAQQGAHRGHAATMAQDWRGDGGATPEHPASVRQTAPTAQPWDGSTAADWAATIPASTAARLAYAAKLQRDRARARSAMDRTAARLAAGLPA